MQPRLCLRSRPYCHQDSVYKDAEKYIYQPSFKTEAIDTAAAGNTFMGYFVVGLYKGADIKEILKIDSADLKSRYVYYINRDAVMDDLIKKLTLN